MAIDSSYMMQNSGYMHQEDIFVATMTVIEHLWFMVKDQDHSHSFLMVFISPFASVLIQARMKLDGNLRVLDIERKIDNLLKDVGLTSRRDVRIGNSIDDKVLSGGEKKRLSFATEVRYRYILFYNILSFSFF